MYDPGLCQQYAWSAAYIETMNAGIGPLMTYLAAHPNQDPAQQYTMPICEACENLPLPLFLVRNLFTEPG
ncbi:MAG: hypothetical protein WCP36_02515 [Methanomicrobiales archaeon]